MRSRVFLFVFPLLLAIGGPAFARGGGTLDSILPEIRAQHPGRMSDAEPFTASDGSTHYRIKWMTPEGRILYFDADAHSGRYFNSIDNDVGRQWHHGGSGDDGGPRWRGHDDSQTGDDDSGDRGRRNWNGGGDGARYSGGNGDWRGRQDGGNGDGRGGRGGNWGGERGGDWRGGHNGGDNGGSHHHHGG